MIPSSILSPARITTTSSVTTSSETLIPTTVSNNIKSKNDFITKILAMKNESLNNPVFTLERYNETIELINDAKQRLTYRIPYRTAASLYRTVPYRPTYFFSTPSRTGTVRCGTVRYQYRAPSVSDAKLKSNAKRNDREISLLKTYDVINLGSQDKLVKKINESEDTSIKYYVPINEMYDIIRIAHSNIGHRGIKYTLKEIKKRCANVTEKQVKLFISECNECKVKRAKPKNSSKLVIKPILSNDFNSRGQVDLIDMQSSPDGQFKFILNYQDHFTKFCILRPLKTKTAAEVAYTLLDIFTTFGAPGVLQSDNGREFTAKVIEELSLIWKDLKIVHGKPRHPQSQGSVERSNQDTKQLIGTWIRENNSTKWSEGLRFVQFQKNSCFHRVLNSSPYSVLFGNEPKLGLSSTSLHPSIYTDITTEEELANKLGALSTDAVDKDSCGSDNEEGELNIVDNLSADSESNVTHEVNDVDELNYAAQDKKNDELHTNRVKRTNDIRETARKGQRRQADEFLQNTAKRQKLANLNVGDNVLVPVPDFDRGPTDGRNVIAIIMEIKHEKFKLGTEQGVLSGYYSFHQIIKASGTPTLLIENVDQNIQRSLREIVKLQSITGGQGLLKCSCKGGCINSRCKCKQSKVLCNSRCHHSTTCNNK